MEHRVGTLLKQWNSESQTKKVITTVNPQLPLQTNVPQKKHFIHKQGDSNTISHLKFIPLQCK
uniref:Uncharacterized protein n=1 Tax=Rhizophora mucronata TaxID=61149 RepID=A0A2P2PW91_RHIMU